MSYKDKEFIVVDLETTGFDEELDRIIEIGMVKVINKEIIDEYSTLINPEIVIPNKIIELTNITNEMVIQAPNFKEVQNKIKTFLGDAIFVSHPVWFDYGFLNTSFIRNGEAPIDNDYICTQELASKLLHISRLDSLLEYYNISVSNRHRALEDARATSKLLIRLLELLNNKNGRN